MDKLDKMSASLAKNLPVEAKEKTLKNSLSPEEIEIKDDYEFSRKTYKELITTGTKSLDTLAELARESEHPRAFEVLSKAIKDIGDVTDKLMALQKNKKDLEPEERRRHGDRTVNNNLFVGSTTELQRLLARSAPEKKVIDVDIKE
jgi:hypothetical protein|tara:strand:+ start:173 stop:610 length:438 start_codon:yes stop_codon:yes gene_type:complete